MHLKSILVFLLVIFSFVAKAQKDIVYYDDFSTNKNGWQIKTGQDVVTRLVNGKYTVDYKASGNYAFWQVFPFTTKINYTVEVKLKKLSGPESSGFGIIWGAEGWKNCYCFSISSNRMFRVWGEDNDKAFVWKKWTINSVIKPNDYNVLKVKKMGRAITFYINGVSVFQHQAAPLFGTLSGFTVGSKSKIAVDHIKVTYPRQSIDLVNDIDPSHKKKNLGRNVNSGYNEIAPIISPDGKTLYVARENHPSNSGPKKLFDVWYANRRSDDSWGPLKRMGRPINNEGDNLVISVSPDGNTLLLEGLYSSTGGYISDQGISISHRTASGWSMPKKVVIQEFYNLNKYESYCPTVDRKILIMSIERRDSYGEKDLYVGFRLPNGEYSKPFNMGDDINTFMNEGTPFIAPDNKTLYFYSYGHPGYGSADIFVTKRLDNSWRKWSKPQNLGPAINSSDWDTYYSISAKGDYAYLVSPRNSVGDNDIFEIKLSEEAKPDPVVLVYGRVYNKKTKRPIGVGIVYDDLRSGGRVGEAQSNPGNGTYKIVLPYGKSYSFRAKGKGYIAIDENIDLRKIAQYKEIKRDLYLVPIEAGSVINLQNVQFKRSKAEFTESSYPELNRLVKLMKEYPKMEIELSGHTDTRGNPQLLMALSQQRVSAVKNYLIEKGIERRRISGKGYGGTKPLGTGSDEIEIKNRRVEFKIRKM